MTIAPERAANALTPPETLRAPAPYPDGLYPYPPTNYDEPYRGQFHFSTATSASQIHFQLANKSIVYDIANQTLLGGALGPSSGQVKIRILADIDWYGLKNVET